MIAVAIGCPEAAWVRNALNQKGLVSVVAVVLMQICKVSAQEGGDLATVDLLVSMLASEAGNLALKVLATRGAYLADGVALHVGELRQESQFVETFTRKGSIKELMERMPIHIVTTPAALVGAATFGLESLGQLKKREQAKHTLASV